MVRDITTTYNVWNIDEKSTKNCMVPKSRTPWKHGDHSSKSTTGTLKKFIIRYDYSIMAAANVTNTRKDTDNFLVIR
jgi:hypothetical protein